MKYPIPADALDDRLAWTGSSGTGKTYDSGTAIERVLRDKSRVCIVDPLGVWWGLRLRADGETPSPFKVAIFGGPHGDIAITETSGKLIGETVAGTAESCIIDLSEFDTEASQRRFMLAFLVALYGGLHGDLLHLVLDESDMWAPQRIMDKEGDATRLHHNMQKIVRRGRVKGFIPWLITQRPAELSKSILSMVDGIIMHQALSPQDMNALMDWVAPRADKATADMIRTGLPAFGRGEAAVYIPRRRVLAIAQFPEKTTFDSSRSPDRGEKKNRPDIALKPLDIDALKKRLAKVEAEAKENDPKALRAELATLRKELAAKSTTAKIAKIDPAEFADAEKRGFDQAKKKLVAAAEADLHEAKIALLKKFGDAVGPLIAVLKEEMATAKDKPRLADGLTFTSSVLPPNPAATSGRAVTTPIRKTNAGAGGNGSLPPGERAILVAAVQYQGVDRDQLSVLTGYKRSSRDAYIQRLREKGYIEASGQTISPTGDGTAALGGDYEPLPTGADLQLYWQQRLPEGEGRILAVLVQAYPEYVDRNSLDEITGYKRSSRDAYLQRLKARRLVDIGASSARASDTLF